MSLKNLTNDTKRYNISANTINCENLNVNGSPIVPVVPPVISAGFWNLDVALGVGSAWNSTGIVGVGSYNRIDNCLIVGFTISVPNGTSSTSANLSLVITNVPLLGVISDGHGSCNSYCNSNVSTNPASGNGQIVVAGPTDVRLQIQDVKGVARAGNSADPHYVNGNIVFVLS